jgi:hypothetical protein
MTLTGTHLGDFHGMAATGRRVEFHALGALRGRCRLRPVVRVRCQGVANQTGGDWSESGLNPYRPGSAAGVVALRNPNGVGLGAETSVCRRKVRHLVCVRLLKGRAGRGARDIGATGGYFASPSNRSTRRSTSAMRMSATEKLPANHSRPANIGSMRWSRAFRKSSRRTSRECNETTL